AADRDHAVLQRDLHVFLLHFRQLSLDQELLIRFADVGGRRPLRPVSGLAPQRWPSEQRRILTEHLLHLAEGLPARDIHVYLLLVRTGVNARQRACSVQASRVYIHADYLVTVNGLRTRGMRADPRR